MVARYAGLAGIGGRVRVHDLRHTAAMLRRLAGADVEEIRDFLRHSSLATTQVYMHRMAGITDTRMAGVVSLLKVSDKADYLKRFSGREPKGVAHE